MASPFDTENQKYFIFTTWDHKESVGLWDGCDKGIEVSESQYNGCLITDNDERELRFD